MDKLRMAVIGTGGMANAHVVRLREQEGVEVTACCDLDKKVLRAFAERHGIGSTYTDYRALLEREQLDAVAVAASDVAHCEVSVAALEAGLHVLCEKPMATSVEEAERMAEAARTSGRVAMIQFSYRGVAALERARQLVDAGELGRVMHVEASYLQSWLANTSWGDWRNKPAWLWRMSKAHRGGTLVDVGCHILDFATYVSGDVAEVSCRMKSFSKGMKNNQRKGYTLDADDSFVAGVTFASGALGVVHSTRWAQGHKNCLRLRVFGDKGSLVIDTDRGGDALEVCIGDFPAREELWSRLPSAVDAPTPFARFVRSIRTGEAESPTFEDGLRNQRLVAACVESAESGRPVTLGPARQD